MRIEALIVAALIAFVPAGARADEAQVACAEMDKSLPAEMAGWTAKAALPSASGHKDLTKAEIAPGRAVTVALHHTRDVQYEAQPAKPGGSVAYGGLASLTVKEAGTYRIGLSTGAWIDVAKGGALVQSTAHGHGPACSTLRKIVDFPLQPGRYVIQISANADPSLTLMVWRQP